MSNVEKAKTKIATAKDQGKPLTKAEQAELLNEAREADKGRRKEKAPTVTLPESVKLATTQLGKCLASAEKQAGEAAAMKVSLSEEMVASMPELGESTSGARKAIRLQLKESMAGVYDNENSIKATAATVELCAVWLAANGLTGVGEGLRKLNHDGNTSVDTLAKAIRASRRPAVTETGSSKPAGGGVVGQLSKLTKAEQECVTADDLRIVRGVIGNDEAKRIKAIVDMFRSLDTDGRNACLEALSKVPAAK